MAALVTVIANPDTEGALQGDVASEIIADKGYHSNDTMEAIAEIGCRSYISEPDRGKRRWTDKEEARDAPYNNRSRIRREKGKALMRRRGELIERSFAHTMESGAMRRAHLRGHENIMKRYHLHTAAFNLGLVMRSLVGAGTPKGLHAKRRGQMGRLGHDCDSIAAMIASGFLGTVVGRQVLVRIDEKRFKLALNAILIVLALRLIWAGADGVVQP